MNPNYRPSGGRHTLIEQGIARGETLDRIAERVGVDVAEVYAVRRAMDETAAEDDLPDAAPGSGPGDPADVAALVDALVPPRTRSTSGRYAA